MGYCLVITQAVKEYHDMEEEVVFPVVEQKLDMHNNEEQHKAFLPQMIEFNGYCMMVQAKEKHDATRFRTGARFEPLETVVLNTSWTRFLPLRLIKCTSSTAPRWTS